MTKKQHVVIEYNTAESSKGGFRPNIYVNGKWRYTTLRNAKTHRGALNRAKKYANEMAGDYPALYNNVCVKERINNA